MQAMELEDDLKSTLEAFDVEVLKGRDYVQVRSNAVNKGVLVTQVLETLRRSYNAEVDLVICLGDDTTDEAMWKRGNRDGVYRRRRNSLRFRRVGLSRGTGILDETPSK